MSNPEQPIKEEIADIKEPKQNKVEGIEVAKTKELDEVVDVANVLAGKIREDKNITEGDVADLKEALGQVKFDIGGEMMTLEQVRQIPDLKKNMEIWQEIAKWNFENLSKLTFLSKNTAEFLSHLKGGYLDLSGLISLSNEAAESLSHHEGTLDLSGLTSLSDKAVESLSHHVGTLFRSRFTSLAMKRLNL